MHDIDRTIANHLVGQRGTIAVDVPGGTGSMFGSVVTHGCVRLGSGPPQTLPSPCAMPHLLRPTHHWHTVIIGRSY